MKYYSEYTKKFYDSEDECADAELELKKKDEEARAKKEAEAKKKAEEEKKKIQGLPKSLGEALDALEADHDYLTAGGVFPEKLIEIWIKKRRAEVEQMSAIPHPAEFAKYYDL